MGANGANQLREIIDNLYDVLAIETISATQAKEFNDHKSSKIINNFISTIRNITPVITNDRVLHKDIEKISIYLRKIREDLFL